MILIIEGPYQFLRTQVLWCSPLYFMGFSFYISGQEKK